jgi:tRNA 2-selenouridine synthase
VPIETVETADPERLSAYDLVIDVRSPAEFAEDHAPGAINLPVLSNEERAEVGTIYVQQSRFTARRVGAAYIARNVARHLETALADRPGSFRPLIYCWRGGQRSSAMATILSEVGWRVGVLRGGYRTYRRRVTERLYEADRPLRVILIDGPTGCGKTELLALLAERGVQTLDLEGLAAHRGSLFGGFADRPQPSQKLFESRLLAALEALDPTRPVVVEAESSKVGERMIPPALWTLMEKARAIELAATPEARAAYLVRAYGDVVADPAALDAILARLPVRASPKRRETWRKLAAEGAFETLALELMALHYDPAYARSRKKHGRTLLAQIALGAVDSGELAAAADQIAPMIEAPASPPPKLQPGLA